MAFHDGTSPPLLPGALRLMLVTDDGLIGDRDPLRLCLDAAQGGCTAIQLRFKKRSAREWLALARQLIERVDIPVLINDRLDIALAAGAAGVHLGSDDLSPRLARRIVPGEFVIGASVGTAAEVERGAAADYWGIGPFRTSTTKADAGKALGMTGSLELLGRSAGRPCVAIGGIDPEDVRALLEAGFAGVAVASGILSAADVRQAARRYRAIMDEPG